MDFGKAVLQEQQEDNITLTAIFSCAKVPLLAVIRGYCYKKLPSRSVPPILSTLVKLIENQAEEEGGVDNMTAQSDYRSHEEQESLSLCFISLKALLSLIETSIRTFFQTAKKQRSEQEIDNDIKSVNEYILRSLWELDSLDSFYNYMVKSGELIADSSVLLSRPTVSDDELREKPIKLLTNSSFLGKFVCLFAVSFELMHFDETLKIWNAFYDFREETRDLWREMSSNAPLNRGVFTNTIIQLEDEKETRWMDAVMKNAGLANNSSQEPKNRVVSQLDLGHLLEQQVLALQLHSAPPPETIKRVLKSMSPSEKSGMPSVHYIDYLECLQSGDYEGSFKSLHRYFDYMMSSRQQLFSHYALLSLATLHAFFGSDSEALRGIDEAIAVARENKDLDCLNYLLTWLFNFLRDRPKLDSKVRDKVYRDQILQFLKLKTKENKNWLLQAMAYQYEALQEVQLKHVIENLTKSSYILLNLENMEDTRSSFVKNCQIFSSLWYRAGIPVLARVYTEIALESSKKSLFDKTTTMLRQVIIDHEAGHVDKALQFFDTDTSPPMSLWRYLSARHLLLQSDNWIKKSRLRQVSPIIDRLLVCSSELNDQDLIYEAVERHATYESEVGNANTAIEIINKNIHGLLESPYCDYNNNYWTAEFELLYGEIIFENLKDPDRGNGDVLDSLKRARTSSYLTIALKCVLNLCERCIGQSSDFIKDPEGLLEYTMSKVLQVDNLWLKAKAYLVLSRAKLENIREIEVSDSNKESMKEQSNTILEYLEISVLGFRKLTDFKMMKKCFEVEKQLADFSGYADLSAHALSSIDQLNTRIQEESSYSAY